MIYILHIHYIYIHIYTAASWAAIVISQPEMHDHE